MNVKLISVTRPVVDLNTPEELITFCARVSNPSNQYNMETAPKLLKYCIINGHWSIFEMADMTVEIETSRAIATQILRHKSFSFQEYSQRYSKVLKFEPVELRKQGETNRQSSEEVINPLILDSGFYAKDCVKHILKTSEIAYNNFLSMGVSKETARMILPLCTSTTLYMKGNIRSWLTYFNQRLNKHTQKEHRIVAEAIRDIFIKEFPIISEAFDNFKTAYEEHFI